MLSENPILENRFVQAALLVLAILLVALTGWRTWKNYSPPARQFDWSARGHSDFHNGTYLPTVAFRNGHNPYAAEVVEEVPMPRSAPPFSPWVFLLHLPFSFLSLPAADIAFFLYNTLLLAGLGWLALRFCSARFAAGLFLLVLVLLLVSRPGHLTLFTGYFTAELAIGMAVALHFARSRPWLAGLGLLLASGKPNFIIPLMILMLCRRDYRAVAFGFTFCAVAALAGLAWLASFSSFGDVLNGLREGLAGHEQDPTEEPFHTWTRTDLVGMVAKVWRANPGAAFSFLAMLPLLAVPGLAVQRLGKRGYQAGASDLGGAIIAVSMLLTVYHHTYDCLILVVPWVAMTFYGPRLLPESRPWERRGLALLLAIPAGNYLSTLSARDALGLNPEGSIWQAITLVSGIALLLALVLLLRIAFRQPTGNDGTPSALPATN